MARRKRNRKKRNGGMLAGVANAAANYGTTAKEGAFILLAAIAAGGAGAAIGKHSLLVGVPLALFGVHKRNKYIMAAGLGFALSNGFQKVIGTEPVETVEGFDVKQIATEAKDRVSTFFRNFSEKLYLPPTKAETTNGLGDDEVTYFVNPYSNKELDMSAIDRVQEQIAAMNQQGREVSGYEIEREF
jgi:hypothetical protein